LAHVAVLELDDRNRAAGELVQQQALRVVSDVPAQADDIAPLNGADAGGGPRQFLSRVVAQLGIAAGQAECGNRRDQCS
jgi:hypothetical protein